MELKPTALINQEHVGSFPSTAFTIPFYPPFLTIKFNYLKVYV